MKYLVPLFVFAFVIAGFAYYTLFTGPVIIEQAVTEESTAVENTFETRTDPTERQEVIGVTTIDALRTSNDALECVITYIDNPLDAEITGTLFTNNGNLRGDFVVPTPDLAGQMVTSIVIDETTIWQWTDIDGEVVGSQQPRTDDSDTLARLVAPIGLNRDVQHNCLTWPNVDRTVFIPPSDILFTETNKAPTETGTLYEEGEF